MNDAAKIAVRMTLEGAQYRQGLDKIERDTRGALAGIERQALAIGRALPALAIAGAIGQSIRSTANYADEMGKLAQKAGTTTEEVSKLAYAARQADVDNAQLAKALRALGEDALTGGEKLAELGIKTTDASGKAKTSSQLFSEVADAIAGMTDPQQKAAAAAQLLGEKVGPELIPLLNQGAEGLKAMADEAGNFGRVVTDDAAKAAETFNDNLTRLQEVGGGLAAKLAGPMIQSLADASSYFLKVAGDVGIARAALISFGAAVARAAGLDDVGKLSSQAKANSNAIALTVKQIETFQRLADAGDAGAAARVTQLRQQFEKLQAEGQAITATLKKEASDIEASFKPTGTPLATPQVGARAFGGKPPKADGSGKGAAPKIVDPDAEFKNYLAGLNKQIEAAQELTIVEKTLRDIQLGRAGQLSEAQREALLNGAAQIEQMQRNKELTEQAAAAEKQAAADKAALDEAGRRMFEATRTDQEQLIARLAEIDRLQQAGAISAETAGRAIVQAYAEGSKAAQQLTEDQQRIKALSDEAGGIFGNYLERAIVDGGKLSDVIKGLVKDLALLIIKKQVLDTASKGFGDWFGSIFSADGGGYTGNGSRSGGIDGKGGFPAILHPQETVIDHTRGQRLGGGGGNSVQISYNIDARNADSGVAERLPQILKAHGERVKADVFASMGRGGSASRAVGRA